MTTITDHHGYAHQHVEHYIPPFHDDGGPITFSWAFPRGTFEKMMSNREIAEFALPHMPAILPFFITLRAKWADPKFNQWQAAPGHVEDLILEWECPGCGGHVGSGMEAIHWVKVSMIARQTFIGQPVKWFPIHGVGKFMWNHDPVRTTISPNLRIVDGNRICNSTIKWGEIHFDKECTHAMAGQIVDFGHPRVYEEFDALTKVVVGDLMAGVDRMVPWIKTVVKGGAGDDWDYLVLDLRAKPEEIKRPKHYV